MSTEIMPEKSAISAKIKPMLRLKEAAPLLLAPFLQFRNKSKRPANNNAVGKLDMNG